LNGSENSCGQFRPTLCPELDALTLFLIKIKLLKIGASINSGPVLPQRARPRSHLYPRTPEVGVVISAVDYGVQWALGEFVIVFKR